MIQRKLLFYNPDKNFENLFLGLLVVYKNLINGFYGEMVRETRTKELATYDLHWASPYVIKITPPSEPARAGFQGWFYFVQNISLPPISCINDFEGLLRFKA